MDISKGTQSWNNREIEVIARRSQFFVFFSIICSVLLGIFSVLWLRNYATSICIIMVIYAVMSFILALIIYFWSKEIRLLRDLELDDQNYIQLNKGYSTFGLAFSFVMIALTSILLIMICFWRDVAVNRFIAEKGASHGFLSTYNMFLHLMVPLLIVQIVCQGMFAFATYSTIQEKEYLRTLIYAFDLIFLISSIVGFHYTRQVDPNTPKLIISKIICIFCIIFISFGVLIVNYCRKVGLYFLMGSIAMLSLFFLAWTEHTMFHEGKQLRKHFQQDCSNTLRVTHEAWVKSQCGCDKYLQNTNKACATDKQAQTWDNSITQQIKCLNYQCCGSVAFELTRPVFTIAFAHLVQLVSGFALVITLLQSSVNFDGERKFSGRTMDMIFTVIFILVLIMGIFLVTKVIQVQQINPIKPPVYIQENNEPVIYPKNWSGLSGCQPLGQLHKMTFTACDSSKQTCQDNYNAVRVSLLSIGAAIIISKFENSPNLMLIQPQVAKIFIFPTAQEQDGFLSVQGLFSETQNFLNNNVQICRLGNQIVAQPKVLIDTYYLPFPQTITASNQHHYHTELEIDNDRILQSYNDANEGEFKLTIQQNTYLNQLKFSDLTIKINPKEETVTLINFYKDKQQCANFNSIPYRQLSITKIAQTYYIGIRRKGYYTLCTQFKLITLLPWYEIYFELVQRNTQKGQFTVSLLQNIDPQPYGTGLVQQSKIFESNLVGSLISCSVGSYFQRECAGMEYQKKYNQQHIIINKLVKEPYLFYVKFEPLTVELQTANAVKSAGGETSITIDTNQFISPNVVLYANEIETPLAIYQIPTIPNQPNLTWLSFCVNGNVGDVTQTPIQQFWTYAEIPNKYQRTQNSQLIFPTGKICQDLY